MPGYIIPLTSIIIGTIISIIILNNYKGSEKVMIAIAAEVILFVLNFILVYIALIISTFLKPNIDYNMLFAIGTLLAMIFLGPAYCYCINKNKKNKKTSSLILNIFIQSIIYIIILSITSLLL